MHKVCFLVAVVSLATLLGAEEIPFFTETKEVEESVTDIRSFGFAFGPRFFVSDTAEFTDEFFAQNVGGNFDVEDVNQQEPSFALQFSFKHGMDRYWIPGISLGIKLEYSYTNIDDVVLAVDGGATFLFDDELLSVHTFGLVPTIELRLFSLFEYLVERDMPPYFEVLFYTGPRIHFNLYQDNTGGNIALEDFEALTIGFEVGGGLEFFVTDRWSVLGILSYANHTSTFSFEENGTELFSGDLNLSAFRLQIGFQYYF